MIMTPKEVLEKWIDRFNAADAVRLTELYAEDAVNHQVANKPVVGKTYGQTNEKYKEDSRKSNTADRKPITYSRASNFGSKNEM